MPEKTDKNAEMKDYIRNNEEKKLLLEELKERAEFSEALFKYSPIQTIVVNRNGVIIGFNQMKIESGVRLPKPGEVMFRDYAGKHKLDMYAELMQCIETGQIKEFPELKYQDRILSIKIAPFSHGAIITDQDITLLKKTEKELKDHQKYLKELVDSRTKDLKITQIELKSLFDNISDVAWFKDTESRYIQVNKAFCQFFECSPGDILNKTRLDHWPKDEIERVLIEDRHIINTRDTLRLEKKMTKKNGEICYIEIIKSPMIEDDGRIIGIVGINRDITNRKLIENSLRDSEEKFRSLSEQSMMGIFIIQKNSIKYVNQKIAEICEADSEDMYHWDEVKFRSLIHPEDRDIVFNRNKNKPVKSDDRGVIQYIIRIIPEPGKIKWIDYYSKLILIDGKKAILGTAIDITAHKEAEKALQQSQECLIQSERLASTGRLSASIAHEINNPLQALMHSIGFVEKAVPENFKEKESINQIRIGITRIEKIVRQLLDIHRSRSYTPEQVQVHNILQSVIDLAAHHINSCNISLKKELCENEPVITAQSQELFQVFLNLMLNACDALSEGGLLSIKSWISDDRMSLSFQDDGCGISKKDIEHIFDPFYTTKANKPGTGLGLSIAKGIVESFRGNITVDSGEGEGAKFTITFPLASV